MTRDRDELDRKSGTVEWYDSHRGVGEIRPDDGSAACTLRSATLRECGVASLTPGDRVTFSVYESDEGRTATDLSVLRAIDRWENEGGTTDGDRGPPDQSG